MFHLDLNDDAPLQNLAACIARQKSEGGRIVKYLRCWSAVLVSMKQQRVEHIPFGRSRMLGGWKHSLFTVLLGPWSTSGLMRTPLILIVNFRGGMDVTADYSKSSIDPQRHLPPVQGQGERDLKISQWIFVAAGIAAILGTLAYLILCQGLW